MSEGHSLWVLPEDYCTKDPCNFLWDGEFVRNWPRVDQLLSNSVYKILPWRFCAVFLLTKERERERRVQLKGRQTRGFQTGGVSRSGLVLPFLSFFGLSRFFRDFPDLLGDGPGIFPIRPFSPSRPIKSTYEEQSPKGPPHTLDRSRKSGKPPGLASLKQLSLARSLSVLKRCVPKTLAFAFDLRLRSKTRCFKTRVLGRRLPNGKPQERLRFRALRSKTLAFKKRIAIVFCDLKTSLGASARV